MKQKIPGYFLRIDKEKQSIIYSELKEDIYAELKNMSYPWTGWIIEKDANSGNKWNDEFIHRMIFKK